MLSSFVIKIRELISGDRPQLEELFLKVRQETFLWTDTSAFALSDFEYDTEGERILVAVCDEEIVGFISVWMEDPFIHHLYVAPAFQGKGVGKALLSAIFKETIAPLQLKCLLRNDKAIAFYKRNGFIEKQRVASESGDYILFEYTRV